MERGTIDAKDPHFQFFIKYLSMERKASHIENFW